jgi:hypothetical protein
MGWRFRKSFKVIPGLRLNLSKSGLSASIGGAPVTLNIGQHGLMGTVSIPGTGISYRQHFASEANPHAPNLPSQPDPPFILPSLPGAPTLPAQDDQNPIPQPPSASPIEVIQSASTELLTSASLKELKKLMQMTFEERESITSDLKLAFPEQQLAKQRYESWGNGFLFKRLFKAAFARRKQEADVISVKVAELQEQLRLTVVAAHIDVEGEQAEPYFRMRDRFAALCECAAIWDIKTHQATDKFHQRTIADIQVTRQRVVLSLDSCDLINWEQKVPHLRNAIAGDIYLYPGFILYRAAKEAFSVLEYHDMSVKTALVSFNEQEGVPRDSKVIGQTWARANKDGSPDRRFKSNYQIPIVSYAVATFKSASGLWEEFHFSNPERLFEFAKSLTAFVSSFEGSASH